MTQDVPELLPCPFCGWADMDNGGLCHPQVSDDNPSEVIGPSGVCCPNCAAYVVGGMDDAEAIAAWNRRSTPSRIEVGRDETGWLIERADSSPAEPWYWAAGQLDPTRSSAWTQNNLAAVRFARKGDAEAVGTRYMRKASVQVRVCEHMWTAPAQPELQND